MFCFFKLILVLFIFCKDVFKWLSMKLGGKWGWVWYSKFDKSEEMFFVWREFGDLGYFVNLECMFVGVMFDYGEDVCFV